MARTASNPQDSPLPLPAEGHAVPAHLRDLGGQRLRVLVTAGQEGKRAGAWSARRPSARLLLGTDESGSSRTHKEALADPGFTETVVTRAFTGRPARALRNRFVDRHDATAPAGYPAVRHLTRGLRLAAAAAGDSHGLHLWAGTGYRNATTGPAGDVIDRLSELL